MNTFIPSWQKMSVNYKQSKRELCYIHDDKSITMQLNIFMLFFHSLTWNLQRRNTGNFINQIWVRQIISVFWNLNCFIQTKIKHQSRPYLWAACPSCFNSFRKPILNKWRTKRYWCVVLLRWSRWDLTFRASWW